MLSYDPPKTYPTATTPAQWYWCACAGCTPRGEWKMPPWANPKWTEFQEADIQNLLNTLQAFDGTKNTYIIYIYKWLILYHNVYMCDEELCSSTCQELQVLCKFRETSSTLVWAFAGPKGGFSITTTTTPLWVTHKSWWLESHKQG